MADGDGDVTSWFTKEVLWWRTVASLVWFWLASPVLLLVLAAALSFSLAHPVAFFSGLCSMLATGVFWGSWLLCSMFFMLLSQWHVYMVSADEEIDSSPLQAAWRLFYPFPRLLRHLVYGAVSFCIAAMCTLLYQPLGVLYPPATVRWHVPCAGSGGVCLSGDFMLMCIDSALVGVFYSLSSLVNREHRLTFPTFQQGRYFRVRAILPSCLRKAVTQAGKATLFFFLTYVLCGQFVFNVFRTMLAASWLNSPSSVFTVWSFSASWHFFFTAMFILFCHQLVAQLFLIFNSQPLMFVVQSSLTADSERLLSKALQAKHRILQYLAFQDFFNVAKDEARRQPIFSLSAGGKPEIWETLCYESLLLINTLSSTLQNVPLPQEEKRTDSQPSTSVSNPPAAAPGTPSATAFVSRRGWPALPSTPGTAGPVQRQAPHGVESISPLTKPAAAAGTTPSTCQKSVSSGTTASATLLTSLGTNSSAVKANDASKSPNALFRVNFAESQKHIWAVQGLCALVVASYNEDRYGVVQKSFKDILNALLDLLRAVESTLPNRPSIAASGGSFSVNVQPPSRTFVNAVHPLQLALVSALQTGVYQVCCTFKDHLHNFPLTVDNQQRLTPFLQFWE